ncbi:redoxin family protein [bacterium]|nr:redoxin family protein [bacterium]
MLRHIMIAAALSSTVAVGACSAEQVGSKGAATAEHTKAPAKLNNFKLVDQNGVTQELYKLTDAKAIVLIQHGVGCPIVQKMTPTINDIEKAYAPKGVTFMMVNSNIQDNPKTIKAEAEKFGVTIPILDDHAQALGEELKIERTAEAFIIEPKTWKVLFHGPVDDRITYGRERPKAENNYLTDGLDAVLAGQPVKQTHARAEGCLVNFPNRAKHS